MKTLKILLVICIPFLVNAQTSTIGVPVLVAYANTVSNGTSYIPTDSGVLIYSYGKGYDSINKWYLFDTLKGYSYNISTGYKFSVLELQSLDTNKSVLSNIISSINNTGIFIDSLKYTYSYDAKGNVVLYTRQSLNKTTYTWKNLEKHIYACDAYGNRIMDLQQRWNDTTGTWVSRFRHYYSYDASNQLVGDNMQLWSAGVFQEDSMLSIDYVSAGKINSVTKQYFDTIGLVWNNVSRNVYDYDALTTDLVDIRYYIAGAPWTLIKTTYYTFDSDYNLTIENTPFDIYAEYTYDTIHNKLSAKYAKYTSSPPPAHFEYFKRIFYTYNEYSQVTIFAADSMNGITHAWMPKILNRYYYDFTPPPPPPSGVNSINAIKGSVKLYPIPASNFLNVDLRWDKEQTALIAIYDINGRLYMQWKVEPALFSHSSIPVGQLPTGNYLIRIAGENANLVEKFSVVH